MYKKHFGFTSKPFNLTPDPDTIFMSETHQEGLAILTYGVKSNKGFLVLTGDVGTGKTTLLQKLVTTLDGHVHYCLLNNPTLTRDEFFTYLASQYGLLWTGNKAEFLDTFDEFLKTCFANNERVLLIIDEAHVLPVNLLEEIRLLSNLDVAGQNIFSIFLVGQPELNSRMSDDSLLPLRQRIGIRFHLERFTAEETLQYILFRLRHAGARHFHIFSDEAVAKIFMVSKGTPRLINIVCDHALLTAFAQGVTMIDAEIIDECIEELHFPGEENPLPVMVEEEPSGLLRFFQTYKQPMLLALLIVLLLLALIVPLGKNSPLGYFFPETWITNIQRLFGSLGG